jgi:thiol-disulfide isomerase/thioredoxin
MLVVSTAAWIGCGSNGKPAPDSANSANSTVGTTDSTAAGKPTAEKASPEPVAPAAEKSLTAKAVLDAMVTAYKQAPSYADGGRIVFQGQVGDQKIDDKPEFLVAMVRPNKLLLRTYQGVVVCDGKLLSGYVKDIPNQVIQRDMSGEVSIPPLYADYVLAGALCAAPPQTGAAIPPTLVLLLAKDPLKTLLYRAEGTELLPSDKLGESLCYRVQVKRQEGNTVYWIDQTNFVLRRVEYGTELLKQAMAGGPVKSLTLTADFPAAQIGTEVDPKAFQFEVPPKAKVTKSFMPPNLEQIGQPAGDFEFVDLDGKPVTAKTLSGKIAVLDFWATTCKPCAELLPEMQELYKQYKGSDKVVFLAVSLDESSVEAKRLRDTFSQWKVELPIVRDPHNVRDRLRVPGIPTSILLGPDGRIHYLQTGGPPGGAVDLATRLKQLVAGEDVAKSTFRQFDEFKQQYEQTLKKWGEEDLYVGLGTTEPDTPRAEIAPPSKPRSLALTRLWGANELKSPGNILIIERPGEPPRILVLDAGSSVAELAPDGKLLSTTPLKIPPERPIAALRTAVGRDGKRIFAGFNSALPQLYVFDEKLQPVLTFPKDDENPRMGIADVELTSFTPDEPLVMLVGYWGIAGVQAVSLEGQRLWSNRTLVEVSRIVPLGPGEKGRRNLMCTNLDRQSVVLLDSAGERKGESLLPNRHVAWITSAPLTGGREPEICALAPDPAGNITVLGLSPEGKELWAYPLPRGTHDTAVERAVAGNVFPDGPGQWIIPAADGSLHILTADGKLLDNYNYGAHISGLAMTRSGGHALLLVATPETVEAWQIDPLARR